MDNLRKIMEFSLFSVFFYYGCNEEILKVSLCKKYEFITKIIFELRKIVKVFDYKLIMENGIFW